MNEEFNFGKDIKEIRRRVGTEQADQATGSELTEEAARGDDEDQE